MITGALTLASGGGPNRTARSCSLSAFTFGSMAGSTIVDSSTGVVHAERMLKDIMDVQAALLNVRQHFPEPAQVVVRADSVGAADGEHRRHPDDVRVALLEGYQQLAWLLVSVCVVLALLAFGGR